MNTSHIHLYFVSKYRLIKKSHLLVNSMIVSPASGVFEVCGSSVFLDGRLVAELEEPVSGLIYDDKTAIAICDSQVHKLAILAGNKATLTFKETYPRAEGAYFIGQNSIWGVYKGCSITCYLGDKIYREVLLTETCMKVVEAHMSGDISNGEMGSRFPELKVFTPSGTVCINLKTGDKEYCHGLLRSACAIYDPDCCARKNMDSRDVAIVFLAITAGSLFLAIVLLLKVLYG